MATVNIVSEVLKEITEASTQLLQHLGKTLPTVLRVWQRNDCRPCKHVEV